MRRNRSASSPKEFLHLRPGEELEPHRVNLARFVRRPKIIDQRLIAAHVALKRVPHFVREDFDVSLGAVEVGKDERHAIAWETTCKIRRGDLPSRFFKSVKMAVRPSGGKKSSEPAAHVVEHRLRLRDHPIVISLRRGIARADRGSPSSQNISWSTPSRVRLLLPQFDGEGHQVLADCGPKAFDIVPGCNRPASSA